MSLVGVAAVAGATYLGFRTFARERGFLKFVGLGVGLIMGYFALENALYMTSEIVRLYKNRAPGPFEVRS